MAFYKLKYVTVWKGKGGTRSLKNITAYDGKKITDAIADAVKYWKNIQYHLA